MKNYKLIALDKAMESDKIQTIVIESFTSLIEIIFREADVRYKGFDVWNYYNKEIGNVLDKSKVSIFENPKSLIFI